MTGNDRLTAAFDKIQTIFTGPYETVVDGFTELEDELYKLLERIERLEALSRTEADR